MYEANHVLQLTETLGLLKKLSRMLLWLKQSTIILVQYPTDDLYRIKKLFFVSITPDCLFIICLTSNQMSTVPARHKFHWNRKFLISYTKKLFLN